MESDSILGRLAKAVLDLDQKGAGPLAREALSKGISPVKIISQGLSRGMREVGEKFKCGEMYMPEVLVACDAYYEGLKEVKPHLEAASEAAQKGTVVLGTIYGDIHTVGKDVAAPVFQAAGYRVIDLGVDVPAEQFIDTIRVQKPELVGLGTYMTATFMHTKEMVLAFEKAGVRDRVKVICGGPAVDPGRARSLGADDASDDAWEAVEKMDRLVEELKSGMHKGGNP